MPDKLALNILHGIIGAQDTAAGLFSARQLESIRLPLRVGTLLGNIVGANN